MTRPYAMALAFFNHIVPTTGKPLFDCTREELEHAVEFTASTLANRDALPPEAKAVLLRYLRQRASDAEALAAEIEGADT